ncbi:DUF305 domain-containing protein [Streptomyces sp. NRRL F-5193]|uniref:DUF305 domain-containing protein n=1 Tax=Streptomyces sp. NRRL F-5193 TaxID=1463860 RepID=UPI00131D569E|nr:DUF305 domain-containing protein [Streptomyces sp. NRRL F-5193]
MAWIMLTALLLVTGCTTQPVTGPPRAEAFNATDTAWIQLMIPMHERALLLTELAPSRTHNPALADLAARTGQQLREETVALRGLLTLSRIPDTRPHEGHNMPGMVSLDTLSKARTTTGKEFDQLLTGSLRTHFTHTRDLCTSEQTSGAAPEARALASEIGKGATGELERLDRLRATPRPTAQASHAR